MRSEEMQRQVQMSKDKVEQVGTRTNKEKQDGA